MPSNVCAQIRLSATFKEKMQAKIQDHVMNIYNNIEFMEGAHKKLCDVLSKDHPLRENGKEAQFLQTLDEHHNKFKSSVDHLGDIMDKYTMAIDVYDGYCETATSEAIERVQCGMPDKVVEPSDLAMLVMKKLKRTRKTIVQAQRAGVVVRAQLKKNEQ